jgi:hypothetical protein
MKDDVATSDLYEKEVEGMKQGHEEALALAAFRGSSVQLKQSNPDYRPGLPTVSPTVPKIFPI